MKRRSFFAALLPAAIVPAKAAQVWGYGNRPNCPVCKTGSDANAPRYSPVIRDSEDTISVLPGVVQMFCQQCGAVYVVSGS